MAAKVSKLDEQFKLAAPTEKRKEGTSSNIFSGISIYVNGYTGITKLNRHLVVYLVKQFYAKKYYYILFVDRSKCR